MKFKLIVFFAVFLSLSIQHLFAQQPLIAASELFHEVGQPVSSAIAFPVNSGFISIDAAVFSQANSHASEIFTIENFPLGSERVTLHVEQFDVLRKDSKLVIGTKNGDVPTPIPPHILLRGSVDGYEKSYVYLAVFDGYAMGYIDASADIRYLIQPVKINSEGASVMIVYKQDDVSRPVSQGEKWKCTAEEFTPNFPLIAKVSNEMSKPSHIPLPQAQKMVHLLNIAIDCDHEYYLALGSDVTRAQNYTIAVLGAHSDIYTRDLNCGVTAGFLRVWKDADPYPGDATGDMLGQFVDYWNSNMANVTRAGALLYSSHGGGGLAYIGTLCAEGDGSLGYGVCGLNTGYTFPSDGYIWDVDVSSHEFGHICGSLHTFNCSWKPPVDSCVAAEGSCYATPVPRKGTIMSYCHLTSFGTELKFHPRVATFLKSIFNKSTCAQYVELPIANAGPDQVICPGSSVSIGGDTPGGAPPFSYSWRPATGLSSTQTELVIAKPATTTTYITSITDGNLLRSYDTVNVIVQKPIVNAGGDVTVCGIGRFTLSGSVKGYPPFTYQWIDTGLKQIIGTTAQVDIPVAKTRTYKFVVTDSVGCTNSAMMTLTVAKKPAANISPSTDTSICSGNSVTLDAGVQAANYVWSNGKKTRAINVNTGGSYYCVVSNSGSGCVDTSQVVRVTVYPVPATPLITQTADSIFSSSATTYQWFDASSQISGATNQKYVPTKSGDYSVLTTNENGCSVMSKSFAFTFNTHAGVTQHTDGQSSVHIFPNPAADRITFDYKEVGNVSLDLSITDLLGKTLYRYARKTGDNALPILIDIHSFGQGTYFIHYSFGSGFSVIKFVKE